MKRYIRILFIVLLVLAIAYLLLLWEPWRKHEKPTQPINLEDDVYVSPIDFAALQARNPDIYGWLEIPGTEISYPLLQSATDDSLYLDHDEYGEYSINGSLFTEHAYNKTDFSDRITVVYGHHMLNGTMFSNLQKYYSDPEQFAKLSEIVVYLPTKELHFHVFAAVPYDSRHIMMTYAPVDAPMVRSFLHSIYSVSGIDANFDESNIATKEDTILILSTCLQGNRQNRYLVAAKLES